MSQARSPRGWESHSGHACGHQGIWDISENLPKTLAGDGGKEGRLRRWAQGGTRARLSSSLPHSSVHPRRRAHGPKLRALWGTSTIPRRQAKVSEVSKVSEVRLAEAWRPFTQCRGAQDWGLAPEPGRPSASAACRGVAAGPRVLRGQLGRGPGRRSALRSQQSCVGLIQNHPQTRAGSAEPLRALPGPCRHLARSSRRSPRKAACPPRAPRSRDPGRGVARPRSVDPGPGVCAPGLTGKEGVCRQGREGRRVGGSSPTWPVSL